jgi:hypothetical protein
MDAPIRHPRSRRRLAPTSFSAVPRAVFPPILDTLNSILPHLLSLNFIDYQLLAYLQILNCKYLLALNCDFLTSRISSFTHSPASDHFKRRTPNNGGLSLRKIHRRKARKAVTPPTGLRRVVRSGHLGNGRSESLVPKTEQGQKKSAHESSQDNFVGWR